MAGGIVASMGTIPLVTILAGVHRSFACHALYLGECLVNGQVPQIHEEDHQHEARVRVRFACAPLCLLQGTRPLQLCDAELALDACNLCHFGLPFWTRFGPGFFNRTRVVRVPSRFTSITPRLNSVLTAFQRT
ncbi:hypothetical protein [Ruegeria sp.]|uniref:hypothetical protein n=1 Tax=Ruegeria sp. TaxID=1879320 RepID=UPI003AFFD1F7